MIAVNAKVVQQYRVLRRKLIPIGLLISLPFLLIGPSPSLLAVGTVTPTPTAAPSVSPTAAPSVSPTDTSTATMPVLPPLILPATVDHAVPTNLKPTLANAKKDRPKPYADHCHTQQNLIASTAKCVYGNLTSKTTIVLFGDSHALSWFPAVESLAKLKKWRLYSLTMSSCWPADIPAWNSTTVKLMTNCTIWRNNTLTQIARIRPAIVLVSGTRGFATVGADNKVLVGDERTRAWQAGMVRTIDRLKLAAKHVYLIDDTPASNFDPYICLSAHLKSILACSTPVAAAVSTTWLSVEKGVAESEKIPWIDPTLWVCSTNPCPPILGNTLIYVDGGHMTGTFDLTLEKRLAEKISAP